MSAKEGALQCPPQPHPALLLTAKHEQLVMGSQLVPKELQNKHPKQHTQCKAKALLLPRQCLPVILEGASQVPMGNSSLFFFPSPPAVKQLCLPCCITKQLKVPYLHQAVLPMGTAVSHSLAAASPCCTAGGCAVSTCPTQTTSRAGAWAGLGAGVGRNCLKHPNKPL